LVRTEGEPAALASALRKQVWAVDPNQPVMKVETMEQVIANSIWRPRFSAWIFSVLTATALLMAAIGVYGVIAYTSALRAREIGIRVALGATPRHVATVILRGAMIPLVCGLGLSVLTALLVSRLLASLLYGISNSDPLTYGGAAVVLLLTGLAASARPAWRAATSDPLQTLRAE
ncbi:MAG: FtsX-like permease family protein, partial [Acidobacteriaceae bacterium]|nr:FtsX-like permease family protein [Acidobacteriaceae bacterium]